MKHYCKDSFNRGYNAENEFKKISKSKGYKVENSTKFENTKLHFDYVLSKGKSNFKVDVKSIKKTSRKNKTTQDEWIWIEFKNVNGNKGWIYGEADYIAFELKESYIMVKREDLLKLAEKKIDKKTIVTKSNQAKYKCYSRRSRPDELVGMLKLDDILDKKNKVLHKIWLK